MLVFFGGLGVGAVLIISAIFILRYFGFFVFGEPIRIGFINSLSGDAGYIGTFAKSAVELAVEEVNKSGGIHGRPLSVLYEDGRCSAKPALEAGRRLINTMKVPAIIGGLCSGETLSFGPLAMEKKVVVISNGSSAPQLSQMGKYFFRNFPSDAHQGKFAAEYAFNDFGAKRAAVIYATNEWGRGLKDVFEKRFSEIGGEIVFSEGIADNAYEYRPILNKIKDLRADVVFMVAYTDTSIIALKQSEEVGLKVRFLGSDGWDDPKVHKEVSGRGEFYYVSPKISATYEFKEKMMGKTGSPDLSMGSANAYDIVFILADALRKAGTNSEKLRDAVADTKYRGVSGYIEFDKNGDLTLPVFSVKKIEAGIAREVN